MQHVSFYLLGLGTFENHGRWIIARYSRDYYKHSFSMAECTSPNKARIRIREFLLTPAPLLARRMWPPCFLQKPQKLNRIRQKTTIWHLTLYEFWSDFLDYNDTRLHRYSVSRPMKRWRRIESSLPSRESLCFRHQLLTSLFRLSILSNASIFLYSRDWKISKRKKL